ncbi:MAG: hypothetical protein M9962_14610 [Oligoflexia bacterium]|nr:hypothetical protein [Oligoflexia bacterium]
MKICSILFLWAFLACVPYCSYGSDSCLKDCRIEKLNNGDYDVFCACRKSTYLKPKIRSSLNKYDRYSLESRFMGASESDLEELKKGCEQKTNYDLNRTIGLNFLSLKTRPICECAYNRTLFGTEKKCFLRPSGENLCTFHLVEKQKASSRPVRAITIFDLQSCLVSRLNHEEPLTCKNAKCDKKPITCSANSRLINIADKNSCCPFYVCESKEKKYGIKK